MNVHKKVNITPEFIANFLKENITRHSQSMTQNKYLTQMANAIIDGDTEK